MSETEFTEDPRIEHEKRLAARGWESDRDRSGVLRELLSRSVQRVYLWAYSQLRARDKAMVETRNALLWASRTLDQVPEGRLLDHWIFEYLATESAAKLKLKRSELGPEPCQVLGDTPNMHYLESYPTCGELREEFLKYRDIPNDSVIVKRSGWDTAEADLDRFLQGHFGDEFAHSSEAKDPLRHRLRRTRFRTLLRFVVFAALVGWIALLQMENRALKRQLEEPATEVSETTPNISEPDISSPSMGSIRDVALETDVQRLTFRWEPYPDADSYRVILMSSKMDTLFTRPNVRGEAAIIRRAELPDSTAPDSYLYKIEALQRDEVIAMSRMATYPPI